MDRRTDQALLSGQANDPFLQAIPKAASKTQSLEKVITSKSPFRDDRRKTRLAIRTLKRNGWEF